MTWLQDLLCGTDEETDKEPKLEDPKVTHKVERISEVDAGSLSNDLDKQSEPVLGFHVSGQCPSCKHESTDLFALASVSAGGSGLNGALSKLGPLVLASGGLYAPVLAATPGRAISVGQRYAGHRSPDQIGLVRCRCAGAHPDTDGKVGTGLGCGSMWLLSAKLPKEGRTGQTQLAAVADEQDKYWAGAQAVSSGAEAASQTVRDVAGKWQTSLTAVLALAAVGTALSRDTIMGLPSWAQWTIGIAAGIAIVGNGVAPLHASLASTGFPRFKRKSKPRDVIDWDLSSLRQAKESAEALLTAVVFAIIAVIAAVVAILFLAFTPDAKGPTEVKLTVKDGSVSTTSCGTVTPTSTGVHFKPSAAGQPERDYPLSSVQAIGPC